VGRTAETRFQIIGAGGGVENGGCQKGEECGVSFHGG
jgi:hypothetical protein